MPENKQHLETIKRRIHFISPTDSRSEFSYGEMKSSSVASNMRIVKQIEDRYLHNQEKL